MSKLILAFFSIKFKIIIKLNGELVMLFDIYLITVLISVGINLSNFTNVLLKSKKYGYKFERIYMKDSNLETSESIEPKGFSMGIPVVSAMLFLTIIPSFIPIINVLSNVKTINQWKQSINHFITFLEKYDIIYNECSFSFDEIEKNKSLFQIKKLSYKHSDICSKEMVESMYIDGVSKSRINLELIKSKKERFEVIKKDKKEEIQKFGNDMVIETELNCKLSLKDKKKLLRAYKNVLLSQRLNMKPIEMAEKIATKNYIKTKKEDK